MSTPSVSPQARYTMYPEKRFAIVYFPPGDLNADAAVHINATYKHDVNYSKIHYLLLIFLQCNPIFKENELAKLAEIYQKNAQKNNHIRSVFLVDTPKATAFAHLLMANTPEESHYCTTLKQAYDLLKPETLSYTEFIKIVEEYQ
jgi:hypothetical protein